LDNDGYLEKITSLVTKPRPVPNEFDDEIADRKSNKTALKTGISFFDDAMCGILKNEVMIVSGKTGAGKTELLTRMACNMAESGSRVLFISLEDAEFSIVRRIAWPIYLSEWWQRVARTNPGARKPRFVEWIHGVDGPAQDLELLEQTVSEVVKAKYPTLDVYYRTSNEYTIDDFEKQISALASQYDVIYLDHLHFFDFLSGEAELVGQKRVLKKIASLSSALKIPIISGAHLRKTNPFRATAMPSIEDLHGSSDIAKIATCVVLVARAATSVPHDPSKAKSLVRTFLKIPKLRTDMSVSIPTALTDFNIESRSYLPKYLLGEFDADDQWQAWDASRVPDWASK